MTHGDTSTYPRKASDFGFIPLSHVLEVAAAVVSTQRDWGNRVNRKNAKTKYTLERVGVEAFKAEVENRAGIPFAESRPYEFTSRGDRFGWVKGIDGKHHLTLFIENGRLLDFPGKPLKTGMLEIARFTRGISADRQPEPHHRRRPRWREGAHRSPGSSIRTAG